MENQQYQQQQELDTIDLRQILYTVLDNWYWFVISIVLFLALGTFYIKTQKPQYESSTMVLLRQEQSAPEEMLLFQDLGLNVGKSNIDNEIGLFKSTDLITRIISSMELHTSYHVKGRFGLAPRELYRNAPLYVRLEDVEPDKIVGSYILTFSPPKNGEQKVEVEEIIEGKSIINSYTIESLPAHLVTENAKFYIAKQESRQFGEEPITVTIRNASSVARVVAKKLTIQPTTKQSTMLEIKYRCHSRAKGEDFVMALIAEYNRDAIADKNTIAHNTSIFIDERLKDITSELGEVEEQVEQFRKKHEITDIPAQVGSYMRRSESYETNRMEIETQQNLVRYIQEFLNNPENKNKLLPNLGLKDQGLVALIKEYNEILLQRERIEAVTSAQNPALKQVTQQVESIYHNIVEALQNEQNASTIALKDLEREYTLTNIELRNVPTVERHYTDIIRQQEVKSNLFLFLLQKREESNLTQAAVAQKAKIVAKPTTAPQPVEPKKQILLLAFFMVGVIVPSATLYLRELLRTKIEGPDDFNKLQGPTLIGDIAASQEAIDSRDAIIMRAGKQSVVGEMFRTMRNNLLFMTAEREKNIILVTSTVPKEGKSFISCNLAHSLATMNKKTLLIGADLRNPQLSNTLSIDKALEGFSSYLAGHKNSVEEMIESLDNNLYVLQSGPIPPNPNELLSQGKVETLLEQLRKEYDYIVIDSAPLGVVSDTFLLASYADATLYITREGYSKKDTISFINGLVADKRIHNVGVVLNFATHKRRGGRYKYGYGYSYRYQYGYGENSN